jgi:hypothetical protein
MKTIKKVAKAQRGIDVERAANQRGVCGKGSVSDRQAARMDRRAERQSRREERQYDRDARRAERREARGSGPGHTSFGSGWKNGGSMAKKKPSMKKGGSFPDLNKDGKVTKADVLVGRGVIKAKKGTAMKKQAAKAIAMKKAGKAPKKAMMGAMSKPMMKMGGMTKKCAYGCK